jgi:hypothetical protein
LTPIAEIDKLIKEWERAHPGVTGKLVIELNYHEGACREIKEFTGRTIKVK